MNREDGKKAFTEAQKEVKEKAIEKLKTFIKKTLEARERQVKIRDEAARRIKILDKDILDLKEGRIDRIEERQKADPKAKETSVAIVEKIKVVEEHHHHYDRWYTPYRFIWRQPYIPYFQPGTIQGTSSITVEAVDDVGPFGTTASNAGTLESGQTFFTLNNSMAKDFTAGAYVIGVNGDPEFVSYIS